MGGTPACPSCGGTDFEEGFVETLGQNGVRWMAGPIKVTLFGWARKSGRAHHTLLADACTSCDRLEFRRGPRTN
jgi:hypothetical protein